MFPSFSLTLMVNHACNLRCTYCYTGAKLHRPMNPQVGTVAIQRAVCSTAANGVLDLGIFGGEPLLEAHLILDWVQQTRELCHPANIDLRLQMTTNGTIVDSIAWRVMQLPEMSLSISHDGLPEVHDRHRVSGDGRRSSQVVLGTIDRLVEEGRDFNVVMVVRPDTVASLAEGMQFLHSRGVRQITPSLDLWTMWSREDSVQLQQAVSHCADVWSDRWPDLSISWFDEKAARLAAMSISEPARCSFGHGQIAVSPAGNLYPCERLIAEDRDDNSMRLPGSVGDGGLDFCNSTPFPSRSEPACHVCALESMCGTTCRCSNFVRTGNPARPDGLLCWLETTCLHETARVLKDWSQRGIHSTDRVFEETAHV